jgi:uncharacterized protein with FMN-binding domain
MPGVIAATATPSLSSDVHEEQGHCTRRVPAPTDEEIDMRRTLTAFVGASVLALTALDGAAAAQAATTPASALTVPVRRVVSKTVAGAPADAGQWGTVEITVTVQTTTITTGTKKKIVRKFTNLGGHYSYHTARSQFIMSQALPILRQEFLQAQNATGVQMVSGASFTSHAFMQSLQSALLKARTA